MRRFVIPVLALVVIVGVVGGVWNYLTASENPSALILSTVTGTVEVIRPGSDTPLVAGAHLGPADRLSTGHDGLAVLSIGSETRIRVGPTSSLEVRAVDDEGVRIELEGGLVEATVRPGGGAVRLGNTGREVIAANADFRVAVDDGVLQVETSRGEVALSGTSDTTRVRAGNQATVVDRHAALGPVPEELLLQVVWPEESRTRDTVTRVAGTTAPGAVVTIHGALPEPVTVRADGVGMFTAEVALVEGENRLDIQAVDPLGRKSPVRVSALDRDTRGPSWQGDVRYED